LYTIGHLARQFNLSRSTLLYYDSIGLLQASSRTVGNYRRYSEDDLKRLEQICIYRQAGLSLEDIKRILDSPQNLNVSILENQLDILNEEIKALRSQQYAIVQILKNNQLLEKIQVIKKETWVALLYSVGFDEVTSEKWHMEFEKLSPKEHQSFLEALGLPTEEISRMRERYQLLNRKEKQINDHTD